MKALCIFAVVLLLAPDAGAICRCFNEDGTEKSCKNIDPSHPVVCDKGDLDVFQSVIISERARADKAEIEKADAERKLEAAEDTKKALDKPCPPPESPLPALVLTGGVSVVVGVLTGLLLAFGLSR